MIKVGTLQGTCSAHPVVCYTTFINILGKIFVVIRDLHGVGVTFFGGRDCFSACHV